MGLLERALEYKRDLNDRGIKTVMDNIAGPADTDILKDGQPYDVSDSIIHMLDEKDLTAVEEYILDPETELTQYDSIIKEPQMDENIEMMADILNSQETETKKEDLPKAEEIVERVEAAELVEVEEVVEAAKAVEAEEIEEFEYIDESEDIEESETEETGQTLSNADFDAIELEIMRSPSFIESCDALLFNIMGQIGVNSSSLLTRRSFGSDKWLIIYSKGISLSSDEIEFDEENRFINRVLKTGEIVYITKFRDDPLYLDYYSDFVSVDARYLFPIIYDDQPVAILFLGDKVTLEDYSSEDELLIKKICDFTAKLFWQVVEKERLDSEISELKRSVISNNILDRLQDKILNSSSLDAIGNIISEEFEKQGIMSYAVFTKTRNDTEFNLILSEREDFVKLKEKQIKINYLDPLLKMIQLKYPVYVQTQPESDELLVNCFGKDIVKLMSQFKAYPYILGGKIEGFICIFRQSQESSLIDDKIIKISKFLTSSIIGILQTENDKNKFIDNFEIIYKRITDDIIKCETLSMPLCLILCTIKNHKSFFASLGYEKTSIILRNFEKIIEVRLSDGDYFIRYSRNKFLVILPGKDKQYGVSLANVLRNKSQNISESSSFELMISFLASEYPRDGNTFHDLLDNVE